MEGTAHATFAPSDATGEGSASGAPMPTTGSEPPDKIQREPKHPAGASPPACDLHPSPELPSSYVPTIASWGDHAPPRLCPPEMPTSFDFTKHCQQRTLTPKNPFNSCLHPPQRALPQGQTRSPSLFLPAKHPGMAIKPNRASLGPPAPPGSPSPSLKSRWWWQLLAPSRGEIWGKWEGKALPLGDPHA